MDRDRTRIDSQCPIEATLSAYDHFCVVGTTALTLSICARIHIVCGMWTKKASTSDRYTHSRIHADTVAFAGSSISLVFARNAVCEYFTLVACVRRLYYVTGTI